MMTQISVFLENRAGQLREITYALAAEGINLRAVNIAESDDYGVLRLITDDAQRAADCLKQRGHIVSLTPVIAVEVPDHPGGLGEILDILAAADINIRYMYSSFGEKNNAPNMIFRVNDTAATAEALKSAGIAAAWGAGGAL